MPKYDQLSPTDYLIMPGLTDFEIAFLERAGIASIPQLPDSILRRLYADVGAPPALALIAPPTNFYFTDLFELIYLLITQFRKAKVDEDGIPISEAFSLLHRIDKGPGGDDRFLETFGMRIYETLSVRFPSYIYRTREGEPTPEKSDIAVGSTEAEDLSIFVGDQVDGNVLIDEWLNFMQGGSPFVLDVLPSDTAVHLYWYWLEDSITGLLWAYSGVNFTAPEYLQEWANEIREQCPYILEQLRSFEKL